MFVCADDKPTTMGLGYVPPSAEIVEAVLPVVN